MTTHRTWIEISHSALEANLRAIQRVIGPKVGVLPMIKANAYGHGLASVLPVLKRARLRGLGVADGQEALAVRAFGYRQPVIVLSSWQTEDLPALLRRNVELVVWDRIALTQIVAVARRLKKRAAVHIKIDTGTSRIGTRKEALQGLHKALKASQMHLRVVGVYSHLANAEETQSERTTAQLNHFTTLSQGFDQGWPGERHIACTAAALRYPESRLSFVRFGIGFYGLWPSAATQAWAERVGLRYKPRPALAWKTRVLQIKRLPARTSIGYGSTVLTKKPVTIGIVPVGYSDGYPRSASNRGVVIVRGKPAPIIGRISMNLMAINLRHVPTAVSGDTVTLIGPGIPIETLAAASGTIHYEIVSRLSTTIPRIQVA